MKKQIYSSLLVIKKKYDDLNHKILLPEIIKNVQKYKKLLLEINDIEEIATLINQYLKVESAFKEAKSILKEEKDTAMLEIARSQTHANQKELDLLEKQIKMLLIPNDPHDNKNVMIEIRGAAGGSEANIFAKDLFDMYKKWAIINSMRLQLVHQQKSDGGGMSLIIFKITGQKVYSKLKFESGAHRVQRVPKTETQGRIHTSTATVTVMPEVDDTIDIDIDPSDLKIDTFRSSGAGGQSVNTTDSAVRITHKPTGVAVSSQNERSQIQNRETCLKILKTKLFNLELQKQQLEDASFRALAGSGARGEKVRTYNYPQDRVTDHRVGLSVSLKNVVEGNINNIIETLQSAEKANKLKESNT